MWDTAEMPQSYAGREHLSHDLPCPACGHAAHTVLPCGDRCDCPPVAMPGSYAA